MMAFVITFGSGYAQVANENLPKKIEEAFAKKFPNGNDAEWTASKNGMFTANFFEGDEIREATFDKSGKWLETLYFLAEGELPIAVEETVKKTVPNLEYYDSIIMVDKPEGAYYQVTVETEEAFEKLQIDVYGKLIKSERVLE